MNTHTFADWLQRTREAQGYSKNALANASGVNRSHIYKMENGEIAEPAEDTRARLHAVFGTSDADLEALGIMRRRDYQRAGRTVTVYEYAPRPLIPPAQVPNGVSASHDPMLAEVLRLWSMLGEPERRHILVTAQMAERSIRQEQTPRASAQSNPESAGTAPDQLS